VSRAQPTVVERSLVAPVDEAPASGLAARVVLWMIGIYQQYRAGRPTGCRYLPTCSAYADEAIRVHGAGRGTLLAVRRLMRCHPWGGHGIDPVPDRSPVCSH
jgi:putative membrane protein insertion efficiency factor